MKKKTSLNSRNFITRKRYAITFFDQMWKLSHTLTLACVVLHFSIVFFTFYCSIYKYFLHHARKSRNSNSTADEEHTRKFFRLAKSWIRIPKTSRSKANFCSSLLETRKEGECSKKQNITLALCYATTHERKEQGIHILTLINLSNALRILVRIYRKSDTKSNTLWHKSHRRTCSIFERAQCFFYERYSHVFKSLICVCVLVSCICMSDISRSNSNTYQNRLFCRKDCLFLDRETQKIVPHVALRRAYV